MMKSAGSATLWKVSIEAVVGSASGSVAIKSSVSLDFVTMIKRVFESNHG